MSGLTLLIALLAPFTRYGFPSGNDLGLGHLVLDAPLNIIPMYAPPRENSTFAEATAANGPGKVLGTLAPFAMVNDDPLWLAGTFPVPPCGAFPSTTLASIDEATSVGSPPFPPSPTTAERAVNPPQVLSAIMGLTHFPPILCYIEELLIFYALSRNQKDRACGPARPGPRYGQSEPPTWLDPAHRVLVTLLAVGLTIASTVLTIGYASATLALTGLTGMPAAISFCIGAAGGLATLYASAATIMVIDPAISGLTYATLAVHRAQRDVKKRINLLETFILHVNECYYFASIAKVPTNGNAAKIAKAAATIAAGGRRPTLSAGRRLNLLARLLGCKMHAPCLKACFVADVICAKLPAAYLAVGCMHVVHAAMHRASTRLQFILGSLCRTRAIATLAIVSASARLRLFWHVTFIMNHFVEHAIVRMLITAARMITMLVNEISTVRFAAMVFLLLGPLTGVWSPIVAGMPPASTHSDYKSKGPPSFSGERADFISWFMVFTAYVSFKLTRAAAIAEGTRPRPPNPPVAVMARAQPEPLPIAGRSATAPPASPSPVLDSSGAITNQPEIDAASALLAAWHALPAVANQAAIDAWVRLPLDTISNQLDIDAAKKDQEDWNSDNTQLYGLLVQGLPTWLVTSIFNTHRNDGLKALEMLRNSFDANSGDGGDHAAHLAKLQARTINERCDVSEDDLRKHFDMMMTQVAAIQRTGNASPAEATLIAFYDNALPISYTTMRQHARRAKHATLLAHHSDMMSQVRAEVNARTPAANAFAAVGGAHHGGGGGGGGGGGSQ